MPTSQKTQQIERLTRLLLLVTAAMLVLLLILTVVFFVTACGNTKYANQRD